MANTLRTQGQKVHVNVSPLSAQRADRHLGRMARIYEALADPELNEDLRAELESELEQRMKILELNQFPVTNKDEVHKQLKIRKVKV